MGSGECQCQVQEPPGKFASGGFTEVGPTGAKVGPGVAPTSSPAEIPVFPTGTVS